MRQEKAYTTVAEYIEDQPEQKQPLLRALREAILAAVPGVEEVIAWNAPSYRYHGLLAGYAAYKNHVRLGIVGTAIDPESRAALEQKGYVVLERGLQLTYDQPVPTAEVTTLLQQKAKENEAKPEKTK